ncbi:MAG: hypothetical protein ACQERB_04955 [Promethearchaeati archaeon]
MPFIPYINLLLFLPPRFFHLHFTLGNLVDILILISLSSVIDSIFYHGILKRFLDEEIEFAKYSLLDIDFGYKNKKNIQEQGIWLFPMNDKILDNKGRENTMDIGKFLNLNEMKKSRSFAFKFKNAVYRNKIRKFIFLHKNNICLLRNEKNIFLHTGLTYSHIKTIFSLPFENLRFSPKINCLFLKSFRKTWRMTRKYKPIQ